MCDSSKDSITRGDLMTEKETSDTNRQTEREVNRDRERQSEVNALP